MTKRAQGDRLTRARLEAGFGERSDVYERHPTWSTDTYKSNENGSARFGFPKAKVYARAFGVRPEWLYDGSGPMRATPSLGIPIMGKVAAGAEGDFPDDLTEAGDYLQPFEIEGRMCLTVVGDSMLPRFRPGERVVFGPPQPQPYQLIGREVMAFLKDGRKLLKVLRKGSSEGLWTLYSINTAYDEIPDEELHWARPFEGLVA